MISTLTPISKVILRYSDKFINRCVLFAGDLQDTLPELLRATKVRVHTQQYHRWKLLYPIIGANAQFGLTLDAEFAGECDALIYYWPKSKQEARFQLCNILSLLPIGADVFVVGENRSGVRSAGKILKNYTILNKIESAHRCSLYHGRLNVQSEFDLSYWWKIYTLHDLKIQTLPGVFSRDRLDPGSALLISTLKSSDWDKILDIGCGAGVIAAMLARFSPKINLILSDVSAAALVASRITLATNGIKGKVIASDVYSNITGHFDMIISNPPFHDSLKTSITTAETLIQGALRYLPLGGRLRIVANAFLPYLSKLDAVFGSHKVLAQNGRFKVYEATVGHSLYHSIKNK